MFELSIVQINRNNHLRRSTVLHQHLKAASPGRYLECVIAKIIRDEILNANERRF